MTEWHTSELSKLCEEKGIPSAKIYQSSLHWRWHRAVYHADTATGIWSDFMKSGSFGDERTYEAVFSYEAQVEACVQSLHSMADILAQIINVTILRSRLREENVSIKNVVREMKRASIATDVTTRVKHLLDDDVFDYVEAFCNTIKHRRLIKAIPRLEYGGSARNENGVVFEEFTYKNKLHPQTWGSDILGKYRTRLLDLITEIGLSINQYVSTL